LKSAQLDNATCPAGQFRQFTPSTDKFVIDSLGSSHQYASRPAELEGSTRAVNQQKPDLAFERRELLRDSRWRQLEILGCPGD
jgi:hypothetical protein